MRCTSVYEETVHFYHLLLLQHISYEAQRRLHLMVRKHSYVRITTTWFHKNWGRPYLEKKDIKT